MQTVFTAFQSSEWLEDFKTLKYAVDSYLDSGSSETPFFVDVGGGQGHQSMALRDRYPGLAKKNDSIVLQDLHQTIKDLKVDGIKVMPHDFFTKQPIIGKKLLGLSPGDSNSLSQGLESTTSVAFFMTGPPIPVQQYYHTSQTPCLNTR